MAVSGTADVDEIVSPETCEEDPAVSSLPPSNIDQTRSKQQQEEMDAALHKAVTCDSDNGTIASLLRSGANIESREEEGLTPLQIAARGCHKRSCKVLLKHGADFTVRSEHEETILHLACRSILVRLLDLNDELNKLIQVEYYSGDENKFKFLEEGKERKWKSIKREVWPLLAILTEALKNDPDLVKIEDSLLTSPGTILNYFALLDYDHGVSALLKRPFSINPNIPNKNGMTPLLIASRYSHCRVGIILLNHGADPNYADDPELRWSSLHYVLGGFSSNKSRETCMFLAELLRRGANPKASDVYGQMPLHMAIGTKDFKVMSRFIDKLGPDCLDLPDSDNGKSFFLHAVATLDEEDISSLIRRGARLTSSRLTHHDEVDFTDESGRHCLPLQEAILNGNSNSYFRSLQHLDFDVVMSDMTDEDRTNFFKYHLIGAAHEVRPDVVRQLFTMIKRHVAGNNNNNNNNSTKELHDILLFRCKKSSEIFSRTALGWAVQNNDRLSATEILYHEHECHSTDEQSGHSCLRSQLSSDELLPWTVHAFSSFYGRTFTQTFLTPLRGLVPILISICTYVFDYHSDLAQSDRYFARSSLNDDVVFNNNNNNDSNDDNCTDYERSPEEYTTAFVVNMSLMIVALTFFSTTCLIELLHFVTAKGIAVPHFMRAITLLANVTTILLILLKFRTLPLIGLATAPISLFVVSALYGYYKFWHLRATHRSLYRKQLQRCEYLWGVFRTAEAGLESSGQIILQLWLLSSNFKGLLVDDSLGDLLEKAWRGICLILSLSANEDKEVEQSLGKICLSATALVWGVAGSYRTLKRGAVSYSDATFIYLSISLQTLARVLSFGLFFFAVSDFIPAVPVFLSVHFLLVIVAKCSLEKVTFSFHDLTPIISIFSSSLVYIRIVPPTMEAQRQSTFLVQTAYFVIAFLENIVLSSFPLFYGNNNRGFDCLGVETVRKCIALTVILCCTSWICHFVYYKFHGHPWSKVNGPTFNRRECKITSYICCKERTLIWSSRKTKERRGGNEVEMGSMLSEDSGDSVYYNCDI